MWHHWNNPAWRGTNRVVQVQRYVPENPSQGLEVVELDPPVPAEGQVLVRLTLRSVNPADDDNGRGSPKPADYGARAGRCALLQALDSASEVQAHRAAGLQRQEGCGEAGRQRKSALLYRTATILSLGRLGLGRPHS